MAGGKGTRLWPLSRAAAPKQFIQLIGDRTLFQSALARVSDPALYEPPIIVTNEDFRFLVAEQARAVNQMLTAIVLEPMARNTAAAIAASASVVHKLFGDQAIIQVLASDHEITTDSSYQAAIIAARSTALTGKLVTFGIAPTEPATGYGYIEIGDSLPDGANAVKRFVEKPTLAHAENMLAHGDFCWNSGMFMFGVKGLLREMELHASEVAGAAVEAVAKSVKDTDFLRLDRESFGRCPNVSIDYAVMEKTDNAAVIRAPFNWSDLGSWDAVWKVGQSDSDGNVVATNTTVLSTKNSLVMTQGIHVAVHGMEEVAVIASEDAVYVGRLQDSQKVGDIVKLLAAAPNTAKLAEAHPTMYRPWGGYTTIFEAENFKVRRIFVTPGQKLPLHTHRLRAEHWIVVRGIAEVTNNADKRILQENESTYIPVGVTHRLANDGEDLLEVIEIQTGSYLGDDDVFRFADDVNRPSKEASVGDQVSNDGSLILSVQS